MVNVNKQLVRFIKEARKRGFGDSRIRQEILNHSWPLEEAEKAFLSLIPKYKFKNQVTLYLDTEVLELIEKRAKKNLMATSEQIEDILRRSCVTQLNSNKAAKPEKLDDTLIGLFSRKNVGRKSRK